MLIKHTSMPPKIWFQLLNTNCFFVNEFVVYKIYSDPNIFHFNDGITTKTSPKKRNRVLDIHWISLGYHKCNTGLDDRYRNIFRDYPDHVLRTSQGHPRDCPKVIHKLPNWPSEGRPIRLSWIVLLDVCRTSMGRPVLLGNLIHGRSSSDVFAF
jgi:hypothetical protein